MHSIRNLVRRVSAGDPATASIVAVVSAILIVVALSIGPSVLGLRSFHGSDILESFSPWSSAPPDGVVPTNPLVGDTVDSILPAKKVFRASLEAGVFGWWNPYQLGGQALAAVPNESLFSPLNLPYWVLPLWYAPAAVKVLELGVAIGFTALFLRRIGLGVPASLLGGLAYAFSGFQVVWNNWSQTHVGALIAALFWAIEVAISKRRLVWALPVAAVVAAMWFEGFPSVTGYGLFFGGIYAIVRALSVPSIRRSIATLFVPFVGVVLGTGLAAIQLAPFYLSLSAVDLGFREQTSAAHLPFRTLATVIVPNAFGSPVDGVYYGPGNYIEIQSFVGVAAVGAAICAVVYGGRVIRRSILWYFVGSLVLCGVLVWVGGPILDVLQETPLFGLNFIGRMRSMFGFFSAVLVAVGFEALLQRQPVAAPSRDRAVFGALVVAVGGVLVFAGFRAWQMARTFEQLEYFRGELRFAVFVLVASVIAVLIAHVGSSKWFLVGVVALPIIVAVEIIRFAVPFFPQVPIDEFYPTTEAHAYLLEEAGRDRVAVAGHALYPSTTSFYGLRSVTGHAFHDPEWQDLLEAVDPDVMRASPTFSILPSTTDVATSPILDRLGARFFVTDPLVATAGERTQSGQRRGSVALEPGGVLEIPLHDEVLRAVTLWVDGIFEPGEVVDEFVIEAIDDANTVLATGVRRFDGPVPDGPLDVSVPEAPGASVVRLSYEGDTPMNVAATPEGTLLHERVRAVNDGLRLVHSRGAVVYERSDVLSRVRWAGRAVTLPQPDDRIDALAAGVPHDTVVLSAEGPGGSGRQAVLTTVRDDGEGIDVRVQADGDGFVVISDNITRDWVAAVDGVDVPILEADHAVAAIAVPQGEHIVELRYRPAGLHVGMVVSILAALLSASVVGAAAVRRRAQGGSAARENRDDD